MSKPPIGYQIGNSLIDLKLGYSARHTSITGTDFKTDLPGFVADLSISVPVTEHVFVGVGGNYTTFSDKTVSGPDGYRLGNNDEFKLVATVGYKF